MTLEQIVRLNNEVISLEELQEIEESECVRFVEDNGLSGNKHYGKHWYSVKFNEFFIDEKCDDVDEIQVYTD